MKLSAAFVMLQRGNGHVALRAALNCKTMSTLIFGIECLPHIHV